MPPTRRRPSDRAQQIVRAASTRFAERGFGQVSMADIARDVGVAPSALYRHFPTKLALLAAAVDRSVGGVELIGGAVDLDAALTAGADGAATDRHAAVLWQREARRLDIADRVALARRLVAASGALGELIARARDESPGADTTLRAWAVVAVFGSTGMHRSSLPRNEFPAQLVASARAVCGAEFDATLAPTPLEPTHTPTSNSTRDAILSQAIHLFSRRGYSAVTTDEIGRATGTSGPNVYKHFPSKGDLLVAIAQRAGDHRRRGLDAALTGDADPATRLTRLLHAHITFAVQQRDLMGILTTELQELPDAARRHAQSNQREYLRTWSQTLLDVRPQLTVERARIIVPATLAIADDAARTGRIGDRADLSDRLSEMCAAVLAS